MMLTVIAILACLTGVSIGFPMGALWMLTKQSDTPAPSKTSEQWEEV